MRRYEQDDDDDGDLRRRRNQPQRSVSPPYALQVSKFLQYAALLPPVAIAVAKFLQYVILEDAPFPFRRRRWADDDDLDDDNCRIARRLWRFSPTFGSPVFIVLMD